MRMIIASTAENGHLLLFVIMINDTMHASIYSDVIEMRTGVTRADLLWIISVIEMRTGVTRADLIYGKYT